MDNKNCCFSGHRVIPPEKLDYIKRRLNIEIVWLAAHGYETFYSGGALGFDLLAGRAVLNLRDQGTRLKLIMAIPCPGQDKNYPSWDRAEYRRQLAQADETILLSEHYYNGCMLARDRFMVDNCSYCICWKTQDKGGTAYTVNYANKSGLSVTNLAEPKPNDGDLGVDFKEDKAPETDIEELESE